MVARGPTHRPLASRKNAMAKQPIHWYGIVYQNLWTSDSAHILNRSLGESQLPNANITKKFIALGRSLGFQACLYLK